MHVLILTSLLLLLPTAGAAEALIPLPSQPAQIAWPSVAWQETKLVPSVDSKALALAVRKIFESRPAGGLPDTRAVLIVQGGKIVLERYAEGFGPESRFHSWSMAKSFVQCLVAILVRDGPPAADAPGPVPAWSAADDPRHRLTLRQLLNMTTGLDNADGDADPQAFVGQLLFGSNAQDMAGHAANVPFLHDPGTHWAYSTGTSAILGGIVSRLTGPSREATRAWMEKELLDPLGIKSLIAESDSRGQLVGGSHVWATARDWARLGLLYLRDGEWDGRRILPAGWVDFSRTRAPVDNNGTYGAHFWPNLPARGKQFDPLPGAPGSAFQMTGNGGQYVVLVPERDLLVRKRPASDVVAARIAGSQPVRGPRGASAKFSFQRRGVSSATLV
ncbi:MAG: serine hydrolase [bacterium]|nr:serine hydrolase [bacterium]